MNNERAALIAEFMEEMQQLSDDQKEELLAFMRMLKGEIPSDPRMALRLNQLEIKMQENDATIPR